MDLEYWNEWGGVGSGCNCCEKLEGGCGGKDNTDTYRQTGRHSTITLSYPSKKEEIRRTS